MPDIAHVFGDDLNVGSSGDLACVFDDEAVRERVLRRLLTSRGTYIWQPSYGAGLASFVGDIANAALLLSIVRGQMLLEADVARKPLPTVSVSAADSGIVTAMITYVSAMTGLTQQPVLTLGS